MSREYFTAEKNFIDINRNIWIYQQQMRKERNEGWVSDDAKTQMLKAKDYLEYAIPKYMETCRDAVYRMFEYDKLATKEFIGGDVQKRQNYINHFEISDDELDLIFETPIDDVKTELPDIQMQDYGAGMNHAYLRDLYHIIDSELKKEKDVSELISMFNITINDLHSRRALAQGVWEFWLDSEDYRKEIENVGFGVGESILPDAINEDVEEKAYENEIELSDRGYWTSKPDWKVRSDIVSRLIKIADQLDQKGFTEEASLIDNLLVS